MQTRPTTWFDTKKEISIYGIKVKHPDHGWIDAGDSDGQFLFETEEEREIKRAELRKMELPTK